MIDDIIIMDRIRSPEQMLVTGFDEDNKLIYVQRGYNGTVASVWKKGSSMKIFKFINAPASIEPNREDVAKPDGTTENVLTDTFLVYEWDVNNTCLPGCYWFEFKVFEMTDGHSGHSGHSGHHHHHDEYMDGWNAGWHQGMEIGENESLDTNFQAWELGKLREYEKWSEEAREQHHEHHHHHDEDIVLVPNVISYISTDVYRCSPLGVKWVRRFPVEGSFLIQITDSPTEL
jgi:hypothetical protein